MSPRSRRSLLAAGTAGIALSAAGCLDLLRGEPPTPSTAADGNAPGSITGWHQPRYDERNTAAVLDADGLEEPPVRYWHREFDDLELGGTPAVASNRIFCQDRSDGGGRILGLDPADGETVFEESLAEPQAVPPVIDGDSVYLAGDDGYHEYDVSAGEHRRTLSEDSSIAPPAVADGVLYAGVESGVTELFALDLESGERIWEQDTGIHWGPPAIVDDRIFYGDADGTIAALGLEYENGEPGTGDDPGVDVSVEELWAETVPDDMAGGAIVADDEAVYVPTGDQGGDGGHVVAYSHDGDVRWETPFDHSVTSSPALADDHLYVVDGNGRLHALETDDGERRWRVPDGRFSFVGDDHEYDHSPVVAGETVVFVDHDGRLHAVDSEGETVWKTAEDEPPVTWSPVVVGDAIVYGGPSSISLLGSE